MEVNVRKFASYREEVLREGGREADGPPLVKAVCAAVITNPVPGTFQEDVSENFPASVQVGEELTRRALGLLEGVPVESYGKGAIVGADGDQEQAVSFLTTAFGDTLRGAVGGSEWVSSVTKRGGLGAAIDIPLASKDVLQARSHYDAVSLTIPDAPGADEIVLIIAVASRGRLNERTGGLTIEEGLSQKASSGA
jgi:hypothetical protein